MTVDMEVINERVQAGRCPDDGRCHHGCEPDVEGCFRVRCCEPLTDTGWGSSWPEEIQTRWGGL